jgi:hypothetical protein
MVSVRKVVKNMIDSRVEHKIITSVAPNIDWLTTGVVSLVSTDIAQGDNITERSGDVIRPKMLNFRIALHTATATTQDIIGRVILFQDSMCNGATPGVTDVLNSASYMAGYKPITRQARRFKILADFTVVSVFGTNTQKLEVTKKIPMIGSIHYLASAAAAASAGRNSVYALFISDTQGTAGQKTYDWTYELVYTDA